MIFKNTVIHGLVVIEPDIFEDGRGYFFESYNKESFASNGITTSFVQDNQSLSQKNVLRGLHFQKPPFSQEKLIRVIQGSVLDIVLDLRKNSNTFGQHFMLKLSSENKRMFYVPIGFAHGFLTLEDNTIFTYKCSDFYNAASEDAILWSDKELNINWGVNNPLLSDKDKKAQCFNKFESPF